MQLSIDCGLSNVKLVFATLRGGVTATATYPSLGPVDGDQLRSFLFMEQKQPADFSRIVVTGGQSARLPDHLDGVALTKIGEVEAVGRGGLALAREDLHRQAPRSALVVSCGSGTAMIAARRAEVRHSTGSAVGGGTLAGLGRLLLDTSNVFEIDELAQRGDPSKLDLTLLDATGGSFAALPSDTTAVNFGKLAYAEQSAGHSREDTAAALVTMIAQTIAMVAINAAKAERLPAIILVGFLPSLPSMAKQLNRVAGWFGARMTIPQRGGYATAIGALIAAGRTR